MMANWCVIWWWQDWKKAKSRSLLPAINKGVAFVKSAASVPSQAPLLSTSASSLSNSAVPSANNISSIGCGTAPNASHSSTNNHPTALTPSTSAANSSQHLIHSKSLSPTSPFDESQVQLSSAACAKSKKVLSLFLSLFLLPASSLCFTSPTLLLSHLLHNYLCKRLEPQYSFALCSLLLRNIVFID